MPAFQRALSGRRDQRRDTSIRSLVSVDDSLFSAQTHHRSAALKLGVSLATAAALAGSVLAFPTASGASGTSGPSYFTTHNVADAFGRTVSGGLGTADVGGPWTTYPTTNFSVGSGHANVTGLKSGSSVRAVVGDATQDESVQLAFRMPALPASGTGTYVAAELRRQSTPDAYRASVRVAPDGTLIMRFTKLVNGTETSVGAPTPLPAVSAGQLVTLQAAATGSTSVNLVARIAVGGAAMPDWQASYTDASPGVLSSPGRLGFSIYQATTTGTTAVEVDGLDGWSVTGTTVNTGGGGTGPATPVSTDSACPTVGAVPAAADPTAGAGSAPVGTKRYGVPSTAIYVSATAGDDVNGLGTLKAPVQTVARAIKLATAGSTIVLRGGTYHESVVVPVSKNITIQPYSGEAVWFDGSSSVSGWQTDGSAWVRSDWSAQFDSTPGYSDEAAANYDWVNPDYPMAAHPDQVWFGTTALAQVGSRSEVTTGTFYVDYATDKLYVGSDPTSASVRASDLGVAINVQSPHTIIRGIGVRRYATPVTSVGAIRLTGDYDSISDVTVTDTASTGLDLSANHVVATHITSLRNGLLGVHGSHAYNLSFSNSVVSDNNTEHFNFAPVSGGVKIGRSRGVVVANNVISDNIGNGLWFDESSYSVRISGNELTGNSGRGLTMEISSHGVVVNNLISDNGRQGFLLEDTDSVSIWNNTFGDNVTNLTIYQDKRVNVAATAGHDPLRAYPDPTMPWITKSIVVGNNIMQSGWPYLVFVADSSGARTATQMHVTLDGNLFATAPATSGTDAIAWSYSGNTVLGYSADQAYSAGFGGPCNRDGDTAADGDFDATQLAQSGRPVPMPASIATAAGWPSNTRRLGQA